MSLFFSLLHIKERGNDLFMMKESVFCIGTSESVEEQLEGNLIPAGNWKSVYGYIHIHIF